MKEQSNCFIKIISPITTSEILLKEFPELTYNVTTKQWLPTEIKILLHKDKDYFFEQKEIKFILTNNKGDKLNQYIVQGNLLAITAELDHTILSLKPNECVDYNFWLKSSQSIST